MVTLHGQSFIFDEIECKILICDHLFSVLMKLDISTAVRVRYGHSQQSHVESFLRNVFPKHLTLCSRALDLKCRQSNRCRAVM
ncbi:hypothetical protein Plhal304r1_c042g0121171 [Plasmopara halstedii]